MHLLRHATAVAMVAGVLAWSTVGSPLFAGSTLIQLPGTAGCISDSGTGGACADGIALDSVRGVAVSPDGKNVYVAAQSSDAIVVFDRNAVTGALTQKAGTAGCISDSGTGGLCVDGVALDGASQVVVSPDGRNVYATAAFGNAVLAFDRDLATGVLTQQACTSLTGTVGACSIGTALVTPFGIAVSPDGRNVYVGSVSGDAVLVFDRSVTTGTLTQKAGTAGCISETGTGALCVDGIALAGAAGVAVSPDGRNLYVATQTSGAVAVFDRNASTGALTQKPGVAGCISEDGTMAQCANGEGLVGAFSATVSPDGRNAYVTGGLSDAVVVFDRSTATGDLTQKAGGAGCIIDVHAGDGCTDGDALDFALAVVLSPEGDTAYVAASTSAAIAVFDREAAAGGLTQEASPARCVSDTGNAGTCVDGLAMGNTNSLASSGDSRNVYATAGGTTDAVLVFARDVAPYDIDGDGATDPLSDGLLLVRYSFGFRGATLIAGTVGGGCTRCTAELIESFIQGLFD